MSLQILELGLCEDKNNQFYFLGIKIKIRYILRDKNLFNSIVQCMVDC